VAADGLSHTMIVAQQFVHNQGDAWQWTLSYLARFSESMSLGEKTQADQADALVNYAAFARAMGTRLGELHALLAQPSDDPAFAPQEVKQAEAKVWADGAKAQLNTAFEMLGGVKEWPTAAVQASAEFLLSQKGKLLGVISNLAKAGIGSLQTRVHGDFHLGQVLVATGDAYIIDFEGEPAKTVEVRRAKSSPLRDVAGLLRSFDYAAAAARMTYLASPAKGSEPQGMPMFQHFVEEMSAQFLTAYRAVESQAEPRWVADEAMESALLDLFLLEKSAYEICYELANRPTWLAIPLSGFADIAARVLQAVPELVDA